MIIRLFLKKEIDIEIKNYKGTALYAAAYEKYAAVIELLLEKMANINTENAKDRTALYKAAAKRYEKVVRLLLEKKIDMNEDKEGRTVLHAAVKGRDVAVEDAALRAACYGVEMAVKGADVENWSAQCKAARKGHKTVIRLLRKHEAAQRRLLKNHADINTTYGQRLLFDVVVPEPAAFLMNAVHDADLVISQPTPLTESATDINEANYASIAVRYQTAGIKAPPLFQLAIRQVFNFDVNSQSHIGSLSANIFISVNYLAYSVTAGYAEAYYDDPGHSEFSNFKFSIEGVSDDYIIFDSFFLSISIGISLLTDYVNSFSGTVRINCIRSSEAYIN
jgi:hypothetical protein